MKRILVTGGCGLIGRNLVRKLQDNFQLIVVDNKIPKGSDKLIKSEKVRIIKGDCRNFNLVDDLVKECDALIHLAAPSSFLMYKENPIENTLNTIQSFLNIMEAAKKHKIKKVVHASTSAVYEGNTVPYIETLSLKPPDLKALSKKVNEEIGRQYSNLYGMRTIALRPFSVYGEEEAEKGGYANVISLFIWAMISGKRPMIWGNGSQTRDYIHADDVAEAFRLALVKDIDTQEINVGTGIETSFNGVIRLINKKLGRDLKPRYVPIPIDIYARRLLADTKRAEKVLGFKPKINLEMGIDRVVKSSRVLIKKVPKLATMQVFYKTIKS